ncbi:TonB-dependent receptor [Abyssalbus ytuae]|uniref:TonB-dependent receptor n=1 Tax=Abyssalbus ytuae TaxID=2926907 RepID=A0A9E7D0T1_9FLAO|nr:TonB-dependent receptor [Abyssalbus ytuae]UOB16343.1 TonB-dependent receptor [Abyssalbus ytuae]
MKRILIFAVVLMTAFSYGQEPTTGSIIGKITDKELNNEPLPFANVMVANTSKGTTTDMDGLFEISNLEPGSYTVVISFIGYETLQVPNVVVVAGKVTEVNTGLGASSVSLDEVVITTTVSRESETALLLEQKKAVEIKTAIGAQELSRKGVGDAATAVTKTTGISKEEGSGGGVFVRGLGDRYNVTTFNGLPLPSNNPSRKNIELDLFSTDIIEAIGIDKTFNVRNYGDFAGANIDITSKNYRGSGFFEIEIGFGGNTASLSEKDFYLPEGANLTGFHNEYYPDYVLWEYNFDTWDREKTILPIENSFSLKGGDSYTFDDNSRLSFFAVGSFENDFIFKEGVSRGSVQANGVPRKDFDYTAYQYNTNTTLMGNLGYKTLNHFIQYNTLYINSTTQKQEEFFGVVDVFDYAPEGGAFVQRGTFDRTSLFVNQLLGDHTLYENFDVNWGASYNFVENLIPNRRQNIVTPDDWDEPEGAKSFQRTLNASDNHRFYQDLEEIEIAANMSGTYKFKKNEDEDFDGKVTLGYSGRIKEVDFQSTQFNFRITKRDPINNSVIDQPLIEDIYNMDGYFNQSNFDAGLFTIATFRGGSSIANALDPQTFSGNQDIHAGFLSVEYAFSPKLVVIAGVRGESIKQTIEWSTSLDPEGNSSSFDQFEVLPMLSMRYAINDKQNLKFAASKTYTLPQFKERALFQFEEVTQVYFGNPSLYPSTDYNVDVKWEMFPESDELISVGAFGKYIKDPINESTVNSATNDISYVNSGDWAYVLGGEIEIRKNLIDIENNKLLKDKLSIGFNVSYMYSNQELNPDKILEETANSPVQLSVDFTNDEDKLSGASDLLLNADVTYLKEFSKDKNIQSTLAFNYFSDRIFALGTETRGNIVEKGIPSLDLIIKSQLSEKMELGFSAKNLFNPSIERFQDNQDVIVSSYKKGLGFNLSLTYKL